jgi:hypothetical protein
VEVGSDPTASVSPDVGVDVEGTGPHHDVAGTIQPRTAVVADLGGQGRSDLRRHPTTPAPSVSPRHAA